ncbi:UDP-glucuronosyl/UDP-glucosyltransferase [Corchorus olitorius]|uniref:UDP-glucuronosyl/UDP-glucosyltransferase n=1 Tax=Corchorus olitorius TaxID=93759 RepID=A0A1R3JJF8_9ROSI|nr:UDP-glucuronosyl/UDP-glucosyltransferase [Corchorus olitorius]
MAGEPKELVHAVMFPYFAFGHISPFIQLSNKLIFVDGVRISFLTAPGNISRIKSSFLPSPNIQIIPLQIPPVQGLPPDFHNTSEMTPAMQELLKQALDLMQPQIKTLLSNLQPQFVFFDFFQHWLPKLCSQLGIKTLCFSVFSGISGAYLTVPARLQSGQVEPSVDDLKKPPLGFPQTSLTSLKLKAFQAQDLSYIFKSFDGNPAVYYRVIDCLTSCTAIVIKTCTQMEGPYVDFIKTQFQKKALLSGPLTPEPQPGALEQKYGQIGWVNIHPKRFTEAIEGRGVIHTGWVQQQLILAHQSVGCYVCHSGFSSVIEALMNDCQLVLLPFKGDQFLNSKLMAGDLKAAGRSD